MLKRSLWVLALIGSLAAFSLVFHKAQANSDFVNQMLGTDQALVCYERGYDFYRQGKFEPAETSLLEALALEPNLLKAHYWLGKLYHEQGRLNDAIHHWEEVERLNKLIAQRRIALSIQNNEYPAAGKIPNTKEQIKKAQAAYQRGLKLLDGGHWDGAVLELKEAHSLYPGNLAYLLRLARTLQDVGDLQGSAKFYETLLTKHWVTIDIFREGMDATFDAGLSYMARPMVLRYSARFAGLPEFEAIKSRLEPLVDKTVPSMGRVVKKLHGQVILNLGFKEGLKLSDEYALAVKVFRAGEELRDPATGKYAGRSPSQVLGDLLITKVNKDNSWALIRREYGDGIKEGDLIEIQKATQ
jgi:tetratricopeptide (TPR) repeat protein